MVKLCTVTKLLNISLPLAVVIVLAPNPKLPGEAANSRPQVAVVFQLCSQVDDIAAASYTKVVPVICIDQERRGVLCVLTEWRYTPPAGPDVNTISCKIFRACKPFFNFLNDDNHILSPHTGGVFHDIYIACSSSNRYAPRIRGLRLHSDTAGFACLRMAVCTWHRS